MSEVDRFLLGDISERVQLWANTGARAAIRSYLGEAAFADYDALMVRATKRLGQKHLGSGATNLIFVPGVMGSILKSDSLGGIWWFDLRNLSKLDELALQPDGKADRHSKYAIAPVTSDPSYEAFLVAALESDDFSHRIYPYDWRKPIWVAAEGLRKVILETFQQNGGVKVNLVAHSMGGLVVRAALARYLAELSPIVNRIVFIATPHYGSPAIAGYLKNHLWGWEMLALLGTHLSRATFRSLWGVLALLPAPRGIYPGTRPSDPLPWRSPNAGDPYIHPCANFDLFDADRWQLELSPQETQNLQMALSGAAAFHREMYDAHMALPQSMRDRMCQISGVGMDTLFRIAFKPVLGHFWEHMSRDKGRVPGDPHHEGDGRVPLASGDLENVGAIRYVKGVHGSLPTIPAVYQETFRWLANRKLEFLSSTPAAALSGGHLAAAGSSDAPHLDGSWRTASGSNPWYLDDRVPTAQEIANLEAQLKTSGLPDFRLARLL